MAVGRNGQQLTPWYGEMLGEMLGDPLPSSPPSLLRELKVSLGADFDLVGKPVFCPGAAAQSQRLRMRVARFRHRRLRLRMAAVVTCAETLASLNDAGRHVCIGLDTDPLRLPASLAPSASVADRFIKFNAAVVEATADIACAFKPNIAFYEALGQAGFAALAGTIREIRRLARDIPVIIDAKRADIGSTNNGYVRAIFDELGADAVTVHPYLGREALGPFLARRDALIFVLARTSNAGAGEFQDLLTDGLPLYRRVARAVAQEWNSAGNCGLVVGATYASELALLRTDVPPSMPFLIPGIGAQGGDLPAVVAAQSNSGSSRFTISVSRSVLYASNGSDFAEAAGAEARKLHAEIARLSRPQVIP